MAWLPDTNVWIQILKHPGGKLEQAVLSHPPDQILLCSVVKAELWHGAHKYENTDRRLAVLEQLFAGLVSLPFDDDAAWHYADIRHQLETAGCVDRPERSQNRSDLPRQRSHHRHVEHRRILPCSEYAD